MGVCPLIHSMYLGVGRGRDARQLPAGTLSDELIELLCLLQLGLGDGGGGNRQSAVRVHERSEDDLRMG